MKSLKTKSGIISLFLLTCFSCKKDIQEPSKEPLKMADTANFAATSFASTLATTTYPGTFTLGINGHPLNSPAYTKNSAIEQIKLVKSMNMGYYRFDVLSEDNGSVSESVLFYALIAAAKAGGVQLVPTIDASNLDIKNASTAFQNGKNLGYNFAKRNAGNFTYYGLGNELDNKCILKNKAGQIASDYDANKIKVVANYLKGMDEGIKLADPTAKTMVDESFLHYGYLQLLVKAGVNFDIVACHWYSEMEGVAAKAPYNIPDITVKLSSLFAKPIWFTEVNERYHSTSNQETLRNTFIQGFIAKCKKNKQVKGLLIYELYDEPFRTDKQEATYGLIKWIKPYTTWEYKLAAKNLLVN